MSMGLVKITKPKAVWINPKEIQIPDVRVTSTWDPEMLSMFKESVKVDGIQNPLICVKDGETLWLVDGKHRLDEALLNGVPRVQIVYTPGSLRQVMTRNLYLNRLRGGVKASEMIQVLAFLRDKEGMSSEQIAKETGLKRDYVEGILECSLCEAEVLDTLDREQIAVGHVHELARIQDRDVQLRLLGQILQYRITVKDLAGIVDQTIQIMKERAAKPTPERTPDPLAVPMAQCHACELQHPIKRVVGVNLCAGCYGILMEAVAKARKDGLVPPVTPPSATP